MTKVQNTFQFFINKHIDWQKNGLKNGFIFMLFLFFSFVVFSQEIKKDTLVKTTVYGLRVGLDLSNPIRILFDSNRKAIELAADYQLNNKIFLATEIGFLDNLRVEDNFDFSTKGEYIKLGINYNTYNNWLNMNNEIYVGLRYGFSTFSQTIESYTIFNDIALPEITNNTSEKFSSLNANWAEFVLGMKVEIYNNVYLGFSMQMKKMLFSKEPKNFKNLYVPGFDRVFLNDSGFGLNYTISYRLPIFLKK